MPTINQIGRFGRKSDKGKSKSAALKGYPQVVVFVHVFLLKHQKSQTQRFEKLLVLSFNRY